MASFPTKELSPRFVFASEHTASLEGFGVQETCAAVKWHVVCFSFAFRA